MFDWYPDRSKCNGRPGSPHYKKPGQAADGYLEFAAGDFLWGRRIKLFKAAFVSTKPYTIVRKDFVPSSVWFAIALIYFQSFGVSPKFNDIGLVG